MRDSRGQVSSTFSIRDGGQEPQQPLAKPQRKKEGQEETFVHRIPTRKPVHSPSVDTSSAWHEIVLVLHAQETAINCYFIWGCKAEPY